MPAKGAILFQSSFINGSGASTPVTWDGGRSALVVNALAYTASALQLQVQGPSGSWIVVGSAIVGDQVFTFDGAPGQYRMVNQVASSVIGVNAVLVSVPYM
jgi:hypothetical protein